MIDDSRPYTFDRVVRLLISVAVLVALYWIVTATASVLVPLAVGVLLAYLLNPIVRFVERRILNRTAAVLVTVGALCLVVLVAAVIVVPIISREFGNFIELVLNLVKEGSPLRQRLRNALPETLVVQIEAAVAERNFQAFLQEHKNLGAAGAAAVRWAVPQIWGVVSGTLAVLGTLVQALLVLLYLVFVLIDYREIRGRWKDYLPPKYREGVVSFLNEFNDAMARYFRGQFVIAMCVGVILAIGFSIVGVRMGVLLGLIIGMMNMVPYLPIVAAPVVYLLAIMTAVEQGHSIWWYVIGVTLVSLIAQALQDAVLTPRIMGSATGLRPVVILFSVLFWGKLLGFLGLLLAIPLTCLGIAYYNRMIAAQKARMEADAAASPAGAPFEPP